MNSPVLARPAQLAAQVTNTEFGLKSNSALLADVRTLSEISNGRALWAMVRQWVVISASVGLVIALNHAWPAYLLAAMIISTRQHALGIIMHDATHYRLFTNRRLSEYGNLLTADPAGKAGSLPFFILNASAVNRFYDRKMNDDTHDKYFHEAFELTPSHIGSDING